MKKETIEKIEDEIKQKTTLPNDIKKQIRKEIFINIIISITMIVYFTSLIVISYEIEKIVCIKVFNICSITFLGISICLFEIAYKKDNGKIALYGIEILIFAILTLFFPYILFELDEFHKKYYMVISIYIGIYYIIKSIVVAKRAKKMYELKVSDIKEIIKKEKNELEESLNEYKEESEIKEKAKNKITKKNNVTESKVEKSSTNKKKNKVEVDNKNNSEVKKVSKKKVEENKLDNRKKSTNKTKDVSTNKKEIKLNDDKIKSNKRKSGNKNNNKENENNKKTSQIQNDSTPKKRGRPKKTETENIEKPKTQEQPKKRGRPRKAVTSND